MQFIKCIIELNNKNKIEIGLDDLYKSNFMLLDQIRSNCRSIKRITKATPNFSSIHTCPITRFESWGHMHTKGYLIDKNVVLQIYSSVPMTNLVLLHRQNKDDNQNYKVNFLLEDNTLINIKDLILLVNMSCTNKPDRKQYKKYYRFRNNSICSGIEIEVSDNITLLQFDRSHEW